MMITYIQLCQGAPGEFVQVTLNDLDAMEAELKKEDVACVIIESLLATYGFPIPDKGYLAGVKKLCEKYIFLSDIWIINITHRLPLFYNTYVTAAINYTILYWLLALSNLLGVSEVFFLKSFIKCAWS